MFGLLLISCTPARMIDTDLFPMHRSFVGLSLLINQHRISSLWLGFRKVLNVFPTLLVTFCFGSFSKSSFPPRNSFPLWLYRVEKRILPVELFLNIYSMLQDINLKNGTDNSQVLSYDYSKA